MPYGTAGLCANTQARLVCQLNDLHPALVDRLELNAKEHRCDVGQDERLILLDEDILGVRHLVVTNEHVGFRADVDELRISLVVERDDVQTVVGTFYCELVELVVVNETCVRSLVGIIVLVGEVLRAEHVEILGAQARVKRIQTAKSCEQNM